MNDAVAKVLKHLDRPVRPRREFEDALLRSCLASLAGAQPLPAADTVADPVAGAPGEAPPPMRSGGLRRWARWGRGSTAVRLRPLMVGAATAALLGGLLVGSLLVRERGQIGTGREDPSAQGAVVRYLDVVRAEYPTIAADVERIGIFCIFTPSPAPQCRAYVLELRAAAEAMRHDLGASAVPPKLAANDSAIRQDLDDLVAGADLQLSNVGAVRLTCCPLGDANDRLHDDVFSALSAAFP